MGSGKQKFSGGVQGQSPGKGSGGRCPQTLKFLVYNCMLFCNYMFATGIFFLGKRIQRVPFFPSLPFPFSPPVLPFFFFFFLSFLLFLPSLFSSFPFPFTLFPLFPGFRAPKFQLQGPGECCELPQRILGQNPSQKLNFVHQGLALK